MPTSNPDSRLEARCGNRRQVLRFGAAALSAGALGTGLLGARAAGAAPAITPPAPAAPVKLPTVTLLDGSSYQPDTGRGTALVVVFWSVDCPFCRNDNPHVEKLHRAAAGRPLKVLTASIDADPAPVARYLQDKGYTFPVTMDSAPLRSALVARKVIPLTCCIDRDGMLREAIAGEMFEEDVLGLLKYAG